MTETMWVIENEESVKAEIYRRWSKY